MVCFCRINNRRSSISFFNDEYFFGEVIFECFDTILSVVCTLLGLSPNVAPNQTDHFAVYSACLRRAVPPQRCHSVEISSTNTLTFVEWYFAIFGTKIYPNNYHVMHSPRVVSRLSGCLANSFGIICMRINRPAMTSVYFHRELQRFPPFESEWRKSK